MEQDQWDLDRAQGADSVFALRVQERIRRTQTSFMASDAAESPMAAVEDLRMAADVDADAAFGGGVSSLSGSCAGSKQSGR